MENFEIEQTRVAHDALGDAYNTALVCSKLNMKKGLEEYSDAPRILASRMPKVIESASNAANGPEPVFRDAFDGFLTKAEAFADDRLAHFPCPVCGCGMQNSRWVNQGDGRFMNLYLCPDHGKYLTRVRFRKSGIEGKLLANVLSYEADEEMENSYKTKCAQARKHGRARRGTGRKITR